MSNHPVVIVTGGASGIGKACVHRFLENGARVVIADCDLSHAHAADGDRLLAIQTDIGDERQVERTVAEAVRTFGGIDVLVNNAAAFVLKSIDASVDDWERILRVNIVGTALMTRAVIPHMKKAGRGAIVNVSSISGLVAQPEQLTYNVTKAGILAMTRCLALDLKGTGIRVNAVSPGWVMTEHVRERLFGDMHLSERQVRERIGDLHLLGRLAEPAEIANAVAFLASEEASFVQGSNLVVDGGYTIV